MEIDLQEKIMSFIVEQKLHNASVKISLDDIQLGLYGNERNDIKGLLARQKKDEERLDKIEDKIKKAYWYSGGFIAAVLVVIEAVKIYFGL